MGVPAVAIACGLTAGLFSYGAQGLSLSDTGNAYERQSVNLSVSANRIDVAPVRADRAFTTEASEYDRATARLLTTQVHQSCCMGSFVATGETGSDGALTIKSDYQAGPDSYTDIFKRAGDDQPLILDADFYLYPYVFEGLHRNGAFELDMGMMSVGVPKVVSVSLSQSKGARPDGIPANAKALRVDAWGKPPLAIWYDPCTYVVYAYGNNLDDPSRFLLRP